MIALLLLPVMFAPPIATPVDALVMRARCQAQTQIERLAHRCAQTLAKAQVAAPPAMRDLQSGPRSGSYVMDLSSISIDANAMAQTFGTPTLVDGWYRYPNAIETPAGVCGLKKRRRDFGDPAQDFEFLPATQGVVRPSRDPACIAAKDERVLNVLCAHAWFNDVRRTAQLILGLEPESLAEDWAFAGVDMRASRTQTGVQARFGASRVTPAQLDTIFGPATSKGMRRRYINPPPFDHIGRTCHADAVFVDGTLRAIEVHRGPTYAQPPLPGVVLPAPVRETFEAVEHRCRAGGSGGTSVDAQELPKGTPRYAHLLARYGASIAARRRDWGGCAEPPWPRFEGHHQFTIPGGPGGPVCTLEVVVGELLRPVEFGALRFAPPVQPPPVTTERYPIYETYLEEWGP